MNLTINGEKRDVPESVVPRELLEHLGIPAGRVVVQVNLKVLRREQLSATTLKDGDVVEIIHFVGGG
jgi:sulfur carrier protein